MSKYCPQCKKVKPVSEFSSNKSKPDGLASQCKPCKKLMQGAWYQKNKATHKKKVRQRNVEQCKQAKEYVKDYLSKHPCVDCGESDWVVLEFDHICGKKYRAVSSLVSQGYSIDFIKKEIDKCAVRCAHCHRRRHYKERCYNSDG